MTFFLHDFFIVTVLLVLLVALVALVVRLSGRCKELQGRVDHLAAGASSLQTGVRGDAERITNATVLHGSVTDAASHALWQAMNDDDSIALKALDMARAGYWCMVADGKGQTLLSGGLRRLGGFSQTPDNIYDFMKDIYPRIACVDPAGADVLRDFFLSPKNGNEGELNCPHKLQLHDGRVVHARFLARVEPGANGALPYIYGLFQDVTEIKRVEAVLQQESDRLQSLFDSSPIGLVIVIDNKVYRVNSYLRNLLGMQEGDNPFGYFFRPVVTPEFIQHRLDTNSGRVVGAEAQARSIDGKEYTLLVSYYRIQENEQNAILGWVVDVTEFKETEAALITARDQAQLAVQAKSRFLANISHEIRTPMNAIIGLSYLLLQTSLSRKQRADLEKIEKSSRALLQLLNDILDVSKIESGKMSIEESEFALNEVLLNLANILVVESERKGIEMVFRIASSVPGILKGDPLRLGQVLLNLTGNAVKFSSDGEVVVSVEEAARFDDKVSLRFSITDCGIGIAPDAISHLFQPFTQADSSSTRRFGGTGIGLAISKSLVEIMGGEISVESELGKGSVFTFTCQFSLKNLRANEVGNVPSSLRGARVLVVDDSAIARDMLTESLQGMHFCVDAVENGLEAVDATANACQEGKPYRFALVDWKMPLMDGLQTTQAILADNRVTEQPHFIIITAHIGGNIFSSTEKVGVARVLLKPVNASTLLDTFINVAAEATADHGPSQHRAVVAAIPAGAHVLVAEDNAINQQVIQELLESVGVKVDLAGNGIEAVEMACTGEYDMVFMDIQMPEMDGISAAMSIRSRPEFDHLPIVAMTAHAMPEDREKSYAAGMNEHISKPVDPQEIYQAIRTWVKKDALLEKTGNVSGDVPEKLQNLPGIDSAAALSRIGGNIKLYTSLLGEFHSRYHYVSRMLDQELEAGNIEAASSLMHSFIGIAASLGALPLANASKAVESFLLKEPGQLVTPKDIACVMERVRPLLDGFQNRLQEVMSGLEVLSPQVIEALTAVSEAEEQARDEELARVLAEVADYIDMQSPEAAVPLASVQDYLATRCPTELEALTSSLDNFAFDDARRNMRAVREKLGLGS